MSVRMTGTPGSNRASKLLVAVVCLAGLGWVAREMVGSSAVKPPGVEVRTATVTTGSLERTIRVSCVVQAERFAALMAPRLRGSRGTSGSYGSGGGKSLVAAGSGSTSSGFTASTGSSASSASSSAASSASTNTAVNSTAASATATSSLGAIRGTQ